MQEALIETQDRILQAIQTKRWGQVDEVWLEVAEDAPQGFTFHRPIIEKLLRKQDPRRFASMYENYLDTILIKDAGEEALQIIDYILLNHGHEDWLRPRLLKALELNYGQNAGGKLGDLLDQAGLNDEAVPLTKSYRRFQDLLGAARGQVFRHATWGLGVVRDLDMREGRVVIDFDLKKNQVMTLEGVRNFLKRIPPEHIHARIALNKEELREEVKNNQAEVLKLALRSFGGRIKVSDLKKVLTERFLTDAEYKRFWENSRKAIKLDPWVDQTGAGVHSELVLRDKPRSFFDQIFGELVKAKTASQRYEVLRDVRRHGSDAEMTENDMEGLYQLFLKPLADNSISSQADLLNHGLLFAEFKDLFGEKPNPVDLDSLIKSPEGLDLVRHVEMHELRRIALERIIADFPQQWPEIFADLAISLDTRTMAWMEREMKSRGEEHYLQVAMENIIAKPDANPDLFVFAARNILEDKWKTLHEALPPIMVFEELLSLLAELHEQTLGEAENGESSPARNAATKIRALLNEGNSRLFKKATQTSTVEEARRILQNIRLHNALSHPLKHQMESILVDKHEDLRKVSRIDEEEEKKKPSFHYTTRESLDRKRTELSQLLTKEIPGMATVIDQARQLGDLRENSEYHAAKDRQKLLMQQAAELEDLIARARVVEEREVTPDTSRFGTRITLRETATGEERAVTLLGIWEAEPTRNVLSYLTPTGSQLMGRKVGDVFVLTAQDGKQTEYEVKQIDLALPGAGAS